MQRIAINGIETEYVAAMDRGLHYGDGVFETIACLENRLLFWQQHMARMRAAAEKLRISFPGEQVFLQDIQTIFAASEITQPFVIKLMLTRGVGERGYRMPAKPLPCRLVIRSDWPGPARRIAGQGARLRLCDTQLSVNPQLAGIKHLNRLDNVLARGEWQDEFDEGLMTDNNANIIEGTMSNVFAVRAGVLYTPALDQCGIAGIIRQQLINIAAEFNIPLQEKNLNQHELAGMDEILLTNSVIGIWPVSEFAGKKFAPGKMTKLLDNELTRRTDEHAQAMG